MIYSQLFSHNQRINLPDFPGQGTAAALGRLSCPAAKANQSASARCNAPRAPRRTSWMLRSMQYVPGGSSHLVSRLYAQL